MAKYWARRILRAFFMGICGAQFVLLAAIWCINRQFEILFSKIMEFLLLFTIFLYICDRQSAPAIAIS